MRDVQADLGERLTASTPEQAKNSFEGSPRSCAPSDEGAYPNPNPNPNLQMRVARQNLHTPARGTPEHMPCQS